MAALRLAESSWYYAAVLFLFLLSVSILAPPFLIWSGHQDAASFLYNLHSYDHQWIYRSQCIFKDASGNLILDDCIIQGKESEANISTLYTKNGNAFYNGVFTQYKQSQIGSNKAEKVERSGMVGYKFANDTRDYAIYIPWMLSMVAYPYLFGWRAKMPNLIWFISGIMPLAIDGVFQLLGFWESTNLIRMVTGAIAGITVGIYSSNILIDIRSKGQMDGKETSKRAS